MLTEIDAQRTLKDDLTAVEPRIDTLINSYTDAQRVHMVGSGDSLFAARAVVPFLRTTDGPQFQVHTAFEFAKYVSPHAGPEDIVVPISVSGNSTQTIEAASQAEQSGARVVGITNASDGILAREFPESLILGIDTQPGWTPGTLTYLGLISALYYFGIRLSGGTGGGQEHIDSLYRTLASIGTIIDASKETASQVAKNLVYTNPEPPFYILGEGPNLATSEFIAAKFHEIGLPETIAISRESEEFAHGEFWALAKTNPVFVVAPESPGLSRTETIIKGIRDFGNDIVVVSDSSALVDHAKYSFELQFEDELFSPLLAAIPLQLVVYYYMLELGLDPNDGTHIDPHRKDVADGIHSGKRYE